MTRRASRIAAAVGIASLMVMLGAAGALFAGVDSSRDLVRIRNSLIFKVADEKQLAWSPDHAPGDFKWEHAAPESEFVRRLRESGQRGSDREFSRALAIARYMVRAPKRSGVPVQSSVTRTLGAIVDEGRGYCSDYTAVFNGLALAAGIPVREWGLSFDAFGGDGHAFSEIFDHGLGKWIFLDTFYSFYVQGPSGEPLSVAQFRRALIEGREETLQVTPIDESAFMFPSAAFALHYYQRGAASFFMIWGNNVFSYDASPAVRAMSRVSRSAEQLAAIASGVHPDLMIIATPENRRDIEGLYRIRHLVWLTVGGGILGLICFAYWLNGKLRRRNDIEMSP